MMRTSIRNQNNGFALIAALFMIVVLAALGMFAIRLSSSQQQSTNLTVLSARASAMALTGLEYGANQALLHGSCPLPTPVSWSLNQPELNGFTVDIVCTSTSPVVLPACPVATCTVYELRSTATYSTFGQPDFVSRSAWRTVSNVP